MANIHGFGSAANRGNRGRNGDEDDDEGQNYFAGAPQGGSGLNVIGPGEGTGGDNPVERIFQRAQADTARAEAGPPASVVRITMYRNGFVVDDGPFRSLDDPGNQPFLADLQRGFVPRELMEAGGGLNAGAAAAGPPPRVDVELSDKRGEDYVPPPAPAYTAFGGEGVAIGGGEKTDDGAVVANANGDVDLTVDPEKPTTTVQVRTHDRKRLRLTLNVDMTLRHLQGFIRQEQGEGPPYVLLAGYPPRRLTNFEQTLEEAGLANAAITQQLA